MVLLIVIFISILTIIGECHYQGYNPPPVSTQTPKVYVLPEEMRTRQKEANLFEDFNGEFKLNWSILRPDPSHWSLEKVPGSLTITTQRGSFEFSYNNDYKNVFLIDFPAEQSDDFQITTCITNFKPSQVWNQAGLVLWNDENNYLKFVYEYGERPPPNNAHKLLFTAAREISGRPNYAWFNADQTPKDMWLRIIKHGNMYELYNSTDGETFNPMQVILPARMSINNTVPCLSVPIKSIGIFTSNFTSRTAPEVDASFEFFEFKLSSEEKDMPDY